MYKILGESLSKNKKKEFRLNLIYLFFYKWAQYLLI